MSESDAPVVYFYPHAYLRDRQLDVVRRWPKERALNPELALRPGDQVSAERAVGSEVAGRGLLGRLPLPNVKLRPPGLSPNAAVYVWGGVMLSGRFVTDLDNPYALVGYKLDAMPLWRSLLSAMMAGERCLEIRCLSHACRTTLLALLGERLASKAQVHHPRMLPQVEAPRLADAAVRFLFIGTQFEIKGGGALLRAWSTVRAALPGATLDIVTHLPDGYAIPDGVTVHAARFSRDEIWQRFMRNADVLVHPTYVESFGMVVLEAMAHGLAVIATDVYALGEMAGADNGALLKPPISIWAEGRPTALYRHLDRAADIARQTETGTFEAGLAAAMIAIGRDPVRLAAAKQASLARVRRDFAG
jgi:glycosyltransferase involved in cell wall biosynthesis